MAALAARSDFGKTELVGHYHNEGLYYVLRNIDRSKKTDISRIKKLIIQFVAALPANTFGKASKAEQKKLATVVLDRINLDETRKSFVWKSHPDFSPAANQSASALLQLVERLIDPTMTAVKAKAQLEQWQRTLARKSLTPGERTILGAAGSVARYSLAYWLLDDPSPDPPTDPRARKCKDRDRIPFAAADILGAVMGGLIGFGLGGPTGALVGGMAGGQLASAA
jgi:hypothetical protein